MHKYTHTHRLTNVQLPVKVTITGTNQPFQQHNKHPSVHLHEINWSQWEEIAASLREQRKEEGREKGATEIYIQEQTLQNTNLESLSSGWKNTSGSQGESQMEDDN